MRKQELVVHIINVIFPWFIGRRCRGKLVINLAVDFVVIHIRDVISFQSEVKEVDKVRHGKCT